MKHVRKEKSCKLPQDLVLYFANSMVGDYRTKQGADGKTQASPYSVQLPKAFLDTSVVCLGCKWGSRLWEKEMWG